MDVVLSGARKGSFGDLSNEETGENDEVHEEDKASDTEDQHYNWAKQSVCTRSLQISMK